MIFDTPNPAKTLTLADVPKGEEGQAGLLLQHVKRPEWGMAVLVTRGDRGATYQFQDGRARKIADSHQHLLIEADCPQTENDRLRRELTSRAGLTLAREQKSASTDEQLISFDEQYRLFLDDFDGGFSHPSWQKSKRGAGNSRRTKSHRDPAVADARRLLGRDELGQLLASARHDVVLDRVLRLLKGTSLVTKNQLAPLLRLTELQKRRAGSALYALLYGDTNTAAAMQAWIDALAAGGIGVSWPLATGVPALVHPDEHVCVRATVFTEQAKWMAPRLTVSRTPNGKRYARLLEMAKKMAELLRAKGTEAQDLLDVHDFIYHTLRPAARKRIANQPPSPRASQVTLKTPGDDSMVDAA